MVLRLKKSSLSKEEMSITFPETPDKVWSEMRGLEEFGSYGPIQIVRAEGSASILNGYIRVTDLNTEAGIQKLNQLAEVVDQMNSTDREKFSGALAINKVQDLDGVLRIAPTLDQYEFISGISSDVDLGQRMVETGQFEIADHLRRHLNYASVGAEYRTNQGGTYTLNGYVKKREEAQVQTEESRTMLLTLKTSEQSYPLVLPASEERLDQAKKTLGINDFSQAAIDSVEYVAPYLDRLIPTDCITVGDANELALCLQEFSENEMRTYCAALSVEEPYSFSTAIDMAMDIDDYELVLDSEREYAREALRRIGADGELFDTIDGYMDFDRFGRDAMDEDSVRLTEFGLVRRMSKPFPPEQEIGPTMT